jgi:hypothetical protein
MTPITISEDCSYQDLYDVVSRQVGSDADSYKQSLRGFSVLWEHNNPSSSFPERTLVSEENLGATLQLMVLRHGRDVLEANRKLEDTSSTGVFG